MPLHILIALVVIGILGVAVLTYALGMARPKTFRKPQEVQKAWHREFPEIPITEVVLCQSGMAALVLTTEGAGVVWAMGADSTARLLNQAEVLPGKTGLTLKLPDYAAPAVHLRLTPGEATIWQQAIGVSS